MTIRRDIPPHIDPIELWKAAGGFYQCPKDADGKRLGPLVGYAGTYQDDLDLNKHYVGEVYFNFAAVEQYPRPLRRFAQLLMLQLEQEGDISVFLGAPMGGIGLAFALGDFFEDVRVVFAEKKVLAPGSEREQSSLVIARHELDPDDRVVIIEDVCNNFSTTEQLINLVQASGATVCAIGCALNRSEMSCYHPPSAPLGDHLPVRSVIHIPSPQFRQKDLEVWEDVRDGNIVWKPKVDWERLMTAMNASGQETPHGK